MLKASGEGTVLMLSVNVVVSCQKMLLLWLVTTANILLLTTSFLDPARPARETNVASTWKTKGKREVAATVDAPLPTTVGANVWRVSTTLCCVMYAQLLFNNDPSTELHCKLPGCTKPRWVEGQRIHDFCGRAHAKQYMIREF